jgi:hypothetical protein
MDRKTHVTCEEILLTAVLVVASVVLVLCK